MFIIVSSSICIMNFIVALLFRYKIYGRAIDARRSQKYAIVWGLFIFMQFLVLCSLVKDFSELDTIITSLLVIVSGIAIYLLLKNGYENDIIGRMNDFRRLQYEYERLSKQINKDIDDIEAILLKSENINREELRYTIRNLRLLVCRKDILSNYSGELCDKLENLWGCYTSCAYKIMTIKRNIKQTSGKDFSIDEIHTIIELKGQL